jgi:Asp-tRNA(Asn)/Glu-tRNA(Gln) amidotransferase A subunit family amidase
MRRQLRPRRDCDQPQRWLARAQRLQAADKNKDMLPMISLTDLRERIEQGALSPDAAIAQSLEAIRAQERTIGAFVHHDERARAQQAGPLRGIAVGIKDIIDTADFPTEMGSQIYRGHRPRGDAPVVMALKRAGATIVGKTTTTAFAANDPTATLNPHNQAHTPGGSSSGSAAAVGAGMIPLALGTQTGGSVIRPASFCGTAAIKPSYRLLPTIGVKCFSWSLDTVGLFGASVRDVAAGLAAMTSRPELAVPASVAPPRIGVVTQAFAGAPQASGADALQKAARAAGQAGAAVRELAMPEIVAEAWRIHPVIQDFEAHQSFAWEYGQNYDAMPPLLRGRLDESKGGTPAEYDAAVAVAAQARAALAAVFDEVDVLVTLSAPGAAPQGLSSTGDPRYNRLWTLMGVPCVNVPTLVADGGLPVGVTVVAPFGADGRALAAASFVEGALRK